MRIRKLAVLAVIPLALGLTACGGDGGDDGVASANNGKNSASASPSQSTDGRDAQLKFAQCMRENGVDVKDPEPGEPLRVTGNGKGDPGKLQNATKKCQPLLEAGGMPDDANDPAVHDAMVKYAQCMRDNGIDVPDPKPGEGLKLQAPEGDPAKARAVQEKCQKHLPGAQSGQQQGQGAQ